MTENERNAIQLAKRMFEHFTRDALTLAHEIISMEQKLGEPPINGEEVNSNAESSPAVTITGERSGSGKVNSFPMSAVHVNDPGIMADPSGSNQDRNEELVFAPEDSLPF